MKTWESDHPKAKLMARKRADILAAARKSFLETGYEGTSMESIAKAADVSIMTLYRHAETKDDLFSAVIANACDPGDEDHKAEFEALMRKPLFEILVTVGIYAQQKWADPDTIALMRTVMAETVRFPHLSEMAYASLVGQFETAVADILHQKDETKSLDAAHRRRLAGRFLDGLIGSDMFRVLLGLSGTTQAERERRARTASDELTSQIR